MQDPIHVNMTDVLRAEVRSRPVVPERHAARLPTKTNRVLGANEFGKEVLEDPATLDRRDVEDAIHEHGIHEHSSLACSGVHPDHWVVGNQ